MDLDVSSDLKEKIYDVKLPKGSNKGKITTYFPLKPAEKKEIMSTFEELGEVVFKSIFSDVISDLEWKSNKEQIKKKFKDELIDLD